VIGDEDDEDDKSLQSDRSIYIDGRVRDDRDLALKLAHQSTRRLLENSCFLPQRAAAPPEAVRWWHGCCRNLLSMNGFRPRPGGGGKDSYMAFPLRQLAEVLCAWYNPFVQGQKGGVRVIF